MFSSFDQSGEFPVSCVNPATKLIGYCWVIRVAENLLAESAYIEGADSYIKDEGYQGIELFLGEVYVHLVDAVLGIADVLSKEGIGGFLCYEHSAVNAIGVTIANGPNSGWA